jgi:hypothetical protein
LEGHVLRCSGGVINFRGGHNFTEYVGSIFSEQ